MKTTITLSVLLCLGLFLAYCADQATSDDVQTSGPYYFPRMIEPTEEQMEALLIGELKFENNCFRIRSQDSRESHTPIWPAGYDYRLTTDSVFVILNASGNEVARTGTGVRLSGGEIRDPKGLEGRIEGGVEKLVLSCPVPYWLVGNEVEVYKMEAQLPASTYRQLAGWLDFYGQHIEDWRPNAFELQEKWTIDSLINVPFQDVYPLDDRPDNWLIYDPSGRFNLDLYARDIMFEEKADGRRVAYALSPDSEVAIENPTLGTRQRLLFCGTPCRFEAGFWENEDGVLVAGLYQGEGDQYHPAIWRIDLDNLQVHLYIYPTPLVTPFPHNYAREMIYEG